MRACIAAVAAGAPSAEGRGNIAVHFMRLVAGAAEASAVEFDIHFCDTGDPCPGSLSYPLACGFARSARTIPCT